MSHQKIAIYPGTFDPITNGHIDIIKRALKIADKLVIGVAKDNSKNPVFSLEHRINMVVDAIKTFNQDNLIEVIGFEGLLVSFAAKNKASIIVRGLRAVSDFEYEFQMFGMNSRLNPDIQTIFLPASESTHFVASRFVKEVARLGGDVSDFVTPNVKQELSKIFKK